MTLYDDWHSGEWCNVIFNMLVCRFTKCRLPSVIKISVIRLIVAAPKKRPKKNSFLLQRNFLLPFLFPCSNSIPGTGTANFFCSYFTQWTDKLDRLRQATSATSNGRELRSCLGRVFNSKLGHIGICMSCIQSLLKLKTRPRFCPVS